MYFGAAWLPESMERRKAGREAEQTFQHIARKKSMPAGTPRFAGFRSLRDRKWFKHAAQKDAKKDKIFCMRPDIFGKTENNLNLGTCCVLVLTRWKGLSKNRHRDVNF